MLAPYGLTEREREIVLMIIDGQTMGGISEEPVSYTHLDVYKRQLQGRIECEQVAERVR